MMSDFEDFPPYVKGSETSRAAAASMVPFTSTIKERVFDCIASLVGGATCDEIEAALNLRHQTASARIRELALAKRIKAKGTRKTRSGRNADVWVVR